MFPTAALGLGSRSAEASSRRTVARLGSRPGKGRGQASAFGCRWKESRQWRARSGHRRDRHRSMRCSRRCLERIFLPLAGANSRARLDLANEYLAITNLAGLRGARDDVHDLRHEDLEHDNLHLQLRHEVDDVGGPSVYLSLARATTEAFDFRYG